MFEERECKIQSQIKIICPHCGGMIVLPMCKAVNGEEIVCEHCQQNFNFRM